MISALESKVKHAQCFDVALVEDGSVVLASKDYRLYLYRYQPNGANWKEFKEISEFWLRRLRAYDVIRLAWHILLMHFRWTLLLIVHVSVKVL